MKRIITICTLFFLGGISLSAQNFDSFKRQQEEAFGVYKQRTQEEWEAYRRKVNAEFAEFLGKPWEQKQGEKPKTEPRKEPDVPPVVLPEIDVTIPEDRPIDVNVNFPKLDEELKPVAPVPYRPKPAEKALSFTFYGTTGSVRFDPGKKVSLSGNDEKAVSRFWKALSGEAYDNIVADCQRIRKERDLCDWAYYKMTEKLAAALYPAHNERAVFHAWLLSQSGMGGRKYPSAAGNIGPYLPETVLEAEGRVFYLDEWGEGWGDGHHGCPVPADHAPPPSDEGRQPSGSEPLPSKETCIQKIS